MNDTKEQGQQTNSLPPDAYPKAMNFIGQNLLTSLVQTMQNLPPPLRSNEVVVQALAAFLGNVIHKQYPQDGEACQQMLERLTKLVRVHLADIAQHSQETPVS